jgi:hypothetical protein
MADLTSISITIQTGDFDGAGTDGDVYLGICGREFHCDTGGEDHDQGMGRTYTFGDGANVVNPARNDPRDPQVRLEDVDRFPVYIRFDQGSNSDWNLARAQLKLLGAVTHEFGFLPGEGNGIWLGQGYGTIWHLRRHLDLPAAGPAKGGAATRQ